MEKERDFSENVKLGLTQDIWGGIRLLSRYWFFNSELKHS